MPWTALTTLRMRTHSGMHEQMTIHCPSGEGVAKLMGTGDKPSSENGSPTALRNLPGSSTAVVCGSPRSWSFSETYTEQASVFCMGSKSKASLGRPKSRKEEVQSTCPMQSVAASFKYLGAESV